MHSDGKFVEHVGIMFRLARIYVWCLIGRRRRKEDEEEEEEEEEEEKAEEEDEEGVEEEGKKEEEEEEKVGRSVGIKISSVSS
ncbi:hypothetical protein V1477_006986 [Vespula maculifrons]|uniref:Uncharacterized protein n=1 Tax=Vespula maculifrons TaxID=7453 RepID=A0ABD2CH85_VESMC